MVRSVQVVGETASILVALTIAGCPLRNEITNRVPGAVEALDGISSVDLEFTVLTDEEREAHQTLVESLGPAALWSN